MLEYLCGSRPNVTKHGRTGRIMGCLPTRRGTPMELDNLRLKHAAAE